ncbi:Cof-like hydrolase family protein [Companilactobacillus kimchiensis]|uniref:Cof-like hydrolase family protein n=2 Tax=Companilactobacillus kimchiensis TaxID=993692 RepID=A0A0R2LEJ4_9LACO|nr:Cof-like hydrolase family protein [Companilactobacillus kimchiensis]
MDGTLLNSTGHVSFNNIQGIKKSGIPFTLVSARAPMEMAETIEKLNLIDPQIAFNGGLIFQWVQKGLKVLRSDPLDLTDIKAIVQLVKKDFPNVSCSCYDLNNWYDEKVDRGIRYESKMTGQCPRLIDYTKLLVADNSFYKIMLITFDPNEIERLNQKLIDLKLAGISIKQSGNEYLEITSRKAQKSKGIHYIQNLEKLAIEEMAAFGDGHNDLPMLKSVGTPIVMGNALQEIKPHGKFITKTNDNDGVIFGIENYLK